MNDIAKLFYDINEPYAAGLFEAPEKSYFYRHTIAHARYFAALRPAEYTVGEQLYPSKAKFFKSGYAVNPQFAMTYQIDWNMLEKKSAEAASIMREFYDKSHSPGGWTHAAPNYKRIVKEGLNSYRERVKKCRDADFRDPLLELLDGMECYIKRSIEYLRSVNAPERLISALSHVPFESAQNYYEGLVSWNMIFHFDGADNLGCLDDGLGHLYNGEDYTDVIGELFGNLDAVSTWSCTIGPKYNAVTEQALRAIRNRRRPMLELRVTPEMPDELWNIAIENIRGGCTNPSFYNDRGIHDMLKSHFPEIPDSELELFCGCGCTETNLQGLTRAGGTDDNIPLALIFEKYMYENLAKAHDFEEFYEGLCRKTEAAIDHQLDEIVKRYDYMAVYLPNPMRTLFTDDCIEKEKDFNAGGARYTWTQSSDSGLINVIDSLSAIRELVFRKKQFTPEEFIEKLKSEDPVFFRILKSCPCFGTDNDDVDKLAHDYAERVYMVYRNKPSQSFVDAYILTEHQFLRYEGEGAMVGPTPDGRKRGEPTCDSIAAIRGKAVDGPTAMLKSAAKLPQNLADGISVLNLTISKDFVDKSLRALVEAYFRLGGIQVQVTCTSVEELRDAMDHPENHRDLIVRVGGYSDYFVNLSPALRKTVLERNVHELS